MSRNKRHCRRTRKCKFKRKKVRMKDQMKKIIFKILKQKLCRGRHSYESSFRNRRKRLSRQMR